LTRRNLSQTALAAAFVSPGGAPVEPHMRLASPEPGGLTVALTFDGCPGGFDDRIASALAAACIPATLFLTDVWMRRNPAGLAFFLAHRDLFAIQNHGARHIPPILGSGTLYGLPVAGDLATVRQEVQGGADAIQAATGTAPRWYRAAAARYSPAVLPVIRDMGFAIAGFSLAADLGASLPAHAVEARIAAASNGDVVLAHINQPHRPSGAGVVAGVLALQRRGARFVQLDQTAVTPAG